MTAGSMIASLGVVFVVILVVFRVANAGRRVRARDAGGDHGASDGGFSDSGDCGGDGGGCD